MNATVGLSPAWRRWVIDNLRRGAIRDDLVDGLVRADCPRELAAREVAGIIDTLAVLAEEGRVDRRLAHAARLIQPPDALDVRASLDPERFYTEHYCANRPVVFPGLVRGWPALEDWTPAALAERYGEVEVTYCSGRSADPLCDRNYRDHQVRAPLRTFLAQLVVAEPGNDLYMISRNRVVRDTALSALLDELRPLPPVVDPSAMRAAGALWIGPAGTVTPMHHDQNNALFCQIRGRKRIRLVSPREPLLHREISGVYNGFDPEAPDPERFPGCEALTILDVTLSPGDCLFLPAGWWHHVRALDLSISVTTAAFVWPNDATWYAPGRL